MDLLLVIVESFWQGIKPNLHYIFIIVFILIIVQAIKIYAEKQKEKKLRRSGIFEVDEMSGITFENYLKSLLKMQGFAVQMTPAAGDYGADLILTKNNEKIVVQAKRYKKKVGVRAVQEIVSAKGHYQASACWVITNNYYTQQAVNLAKSNQVRLIDRDELITWMIQEKDAQAKVS